MSKKDNEFVNVNEDYELNDILSKNGYRETKANRDLLSSNFPNNTKHSDVSSLINKISGLEKSK